MRVSAFYLAIVIGSSMQLLLASSGNGQSIDDIKVTVGLSKGESLEKLFKAIEKQSDLFFAFDYVKVNQYNNISLLKTTRSIRETLDAALKETPFIYRQVKNNVVVFQEGEDPEIFLAKKDKEAKNMVRINGTVTDGEGTPMAGVNVIVKGTTRGTSTDAEGKFAIDAEDTEVLVFSFIGFKTIETQVAARVVIDVILQEEAEALREIVVNVGYWNEAEREKTGSISKVTAEEISKQPVTNPLATLQGRMSGVYIQQTTGVPGGEFKIQIRGRNSLRDEGNEPLFIVDGVPFSTEKTTSYRTNSAVFGRPTYGNSGASPLTSINPSDIESIEVLKDADATAIYGSRGANGVVLITTKKGKVGKTTFDLNVYSGVGKAFRTKLLNRKQFLAMRNTAFINDGIVPSAVPGNPGYSPELMIWDTTRSTDWQDVLIGGLARTASIQGSVSGGSENTQFLFSLGYRKENLVYPTNTGFQQGSFLLSASQFSTSKKFSLTVSIRGAKDKNNQPSFNFNKASRELAPNAPSLFDETGALNWENGTWNNPLAQLEHRYNADIINFSGNAVVGYEIIKGLQFKTSFGVNYLQSGEITKFPATRLKDPVQGDAVSIRSQVNASSGTNASWVIEPQVNFDKKVAKGKLTLLGGATFQEQQFIKKSDNYFSFPNDALLNNLASAARVTNYETVQSLYRYAALFGRLNYNWDGRYILNFTARRDGSSRFGPAKQFANFGAIGAAWIFSGEPFIKDNLSFLTFGKIRASYGSAGSDQIGNYQYLDSYATEIALNASNQYQGVTGLSPTKLFNPDYAWEINKKFEAALEIAILEDRLSLEISYFNNRSSNQLITYSLPQTTGFSGILSNRDATVQNTGVELELANDNLRSETLWWTTSLNITFPRNKLIEFPGLEASAYANRFSVGEPLSIVRVYESTGVNPETGLWTFRDINGDGEVSYPDDMQKIMFVGQYFFGGLNNSLKYHGLSLDFLFQFVKQMGYGPWWTSMNQPGTGRNLPAFFLDKKIWREPADIAEVQRFATENNLEAKRAFANYATSDAAVGDASFVRLKNISLSYQLPKKWTKNVTCRFYFQGQNLFIITDFESGDPEIQYSGLGPLRMFTIGIQLTL